MANDNGKTEYMRVSEDGFLEIRKKLDKGEISASGKSTVFFSTKGNKDIGDGYMLGVNLYKSRR